MEELAGEAAFALALGTISRETSGAGLDYSQVLGAQEGEKSDASSKAVAKSAKHLEAERFCLGCQESQC